MSRLLIGMLFAVAPGAVAYWKGRRLVASLDAPALAERTQAALTRVQTAAFAVAILMPLALPHPSVALLIALSYVGGFVGWYPARRAIFRETWSLAGYLSHSLRFLLGYFGYWIAAASAPMFLDGRWASAAVYGAILVVWNIGYGWLLAKLMYARRLDRAELEERFAAISARSAVAAPRVFACGPEQGTWPMAFSLPAVRGRSTVLIARTLLKRLEPDEIGAIYAHEVAHLEEHRGGKLARAIAFSFGLTFAAVAAPVLLRNREVDLGWASGAVSLALFVIVFAWMVSRKGDETKSDLRAAELCGDREAVASALAKLHQLGQIPRRMESEAEALSTHPSLARRLQALRGGAPRALVEPVVLASSTPGSFVVLEAERVRWLEGVPEGTVSTPAALQEAARVVRGYAVSELSELRIATRRGRIEFHARCGNEVQRLDLRPEDARRAEEALNLLDGRLARSESAGTRAMARLAACFTIVAAFVAGSPIAVLLPGAAALSKPGPFAQTSLGVVGAGVGLLGLAGQTASAPGIAAGVALTAFGLLCAAFGIRAARRQGSLPARELLTVAALLPAAAFAVGAVAMAIGSPGTLATVYLAANDWLTGTLHLLGLAVGLWAVRRSVLLWLPAATAASALLLAGLPATANLWVQDPFLGPRAADPVTAIELKPAGSAKLDCLAYELKLSPDGAHFAAGPCTSEDGEREYLVGGFDGWRHSVKAESIALPIGGRALVLADGEAGQQARLLSVEPSGTREIWSVAVPASLSALSASTSAWRGDGADWEKRQLVSVRGELEKAEIHTRRFAFPTEGERRLVPSSFVGLEEGFVAPSAVVEPRALLGFAAAVGKGPRAVFLVASEAPPAVVDTALTLGCAAGCPGDADALCMSSATERTWLWRVPLQPGAHRLEQTWSGDFSQIVRGPGDVVAVRSSERLLLARAGGSTYGVSCEESCGTRMLAAAVGWRHVALVVDGEKGVELRRFELPPDLAEEAPPPQREAGGEQAMSSAE